MSKGLLPFLTRAWGLQLLWPLRSITFRKEFLYLSPYTLLLGAEKRPFGFLFYPVFQLTTEMRWMLLL